ncbi:MAG: AAA family ATPase [Potamolinea sp.]
MLKKIILENWKSFRYAEIPIDPLTVLIGTNASGKSNLIDALEFLKRIAKGEEIQAVLAGIRGGVEWAACKPQTQFTLKVLVQGEDDDTEYLYSITVETHPPVHILATSLDKIKQQPNTEENPERENLYKALISPSSFPFLNVEIYSYLNQRHQWFYSNSPFLTSVGITPDLIVDSTVTIDIPEEIFTANEGCKFIKQTLEKLFILDPIPSKMRSYSPLSNSLQSDASNIAGVLAALSEEQKAEVEVIISKYIKDLPERDIQKVWAETVGRLGSDAMLYCEELWIPNQPPTLIDARGMSDGTLRFIAILTALLTQPKGSQIVIEEVDNGLHPSRSGLLVRMLREIGEQRQIDILVTTHNPALLDAFGSEIVPFVVVAHRDSQTGESKLTLLEELENLPKLIASASLGKLTTKGAIERSLSDTK